MKALFNYIFCFTFSIYFVSAQNEYTESVFRQVSHTHSNILFENKIEETVEFNYYIFMHMHMYMGGGVATADFNNDGLADIYFTATMGENKLYLNKGNLQFEDITKKANVQGEELKLIDYKVTRC